MCILGEPSTGQPLCLVVETTSSLSINMVKTVTSNIAVLHRADWLVNYAVV